MVVATGLFDTEGNAIGSEEEYLPPDTSSEFPDTSSVIFLGLRKDHPFIDHLVRESGPVSGLLHPYLPGQRIEPVPGPPAPPTR